MSPFIRCAGPVALQALSVVVDGFDERSDGYWAVALSTKKISPLDGGGWFNDHT